MPRLNWSETALAGVHAVRREALADARGSFVRLFCAEELACAGWHSALVQVNLSRTERAGTLRGLHWQRPPHAEMKLVSCIRGAVFDVAVDLRPHSPSYLQWHGQVLSADNQTALLIPQGCAHGFQVLEDSTELLYCHSTAFQGGAEAGLHPLDPQLAIRWPMPAGLLSDRDAALPTLAAWVAERDA
jgi:dTDP-4-dehydrorhamnose 3,5-epimerase